MPRITIIHPTALLLLLAASHAAAAPTRSAEQIYRTTCGYCHGANVGPLILGRQLPAEVVSAVVRSGLNAMPAFRPTEINDNELDAVAKWISASKADAKEYGR